MTRPPRLHVQQALLLQGIRRPESPSVPT